MVFVLAEAVRMINRQFFKSPGAVLSLNQDARGRWLCVRFVGANDALERRQGLLGFVDLAPWVDTFAENLCQATIHAIWLSCCPGSFRRGGATVLAERASEEDIHRSMVGVLEATEVYNADGAADEQLAGTLLEGLRLDDIRLDEPMLPNVKAVNRDRAHAARTMPKRGWAADPYLWSVHQGVVGKGCWMQRIQNSDALQRVYNDCITHSAGKIVAAERVKDTSTSKYY